MKDIIPFLKHLLIITTQEKKDKDSPDTFATLASLATNPQPYSTCSVIQ